MSDFHFYCAICGAAMTAQRHTAGGLKECPACHHVIPIPGYPERPGAPLEILGIFRPEILDVVMKFLCPHCESKMCVDVRWEGRAVECPHCHQPFHVPSWSSSEPRATPFPRPTTIRPPERAGRTSLSADEIAFLSDPPEAKAV